MIQVIFDIDGTLADTSHRQHHLANKDWESFYNAMPGDAPIQPIIDLCNMYFNSGSYILLVTGRPESHRELTREWLNKHHVLFDEIRMRPTGDHRPDTEVKMELVSPWDIANTELVVEDRSSMVRAWRERGLLCLQCAEGNF